MIIEFIIIFLSVVILIDVRESSRTYKCPVSDHFNGRSFRNIYTDKNIFKIIHHKTGDEVTFFSFFLKKVCSHWKKRPLPSGQTVPVSRVIGSDIVVTHINHSTILIQTEGINILTDPVWAKRASPFSFFGPKRYMDPGIAFENLPPIDIVLLTHNHYDHCDIETLGKISKKYRPKIFTPLGNSGFLVKKGIYEGIDMDWGESRKYSDEIVISCVPAQHFSARSLSDRNYSLWGGFVVRTPHGDIYFAGDTGYGPFVERIKKVYPEGFRLAFLPIGSFKPVSLMSEMHMSPDDAVHLYKEVKAKHAIPIHFGTFNLALDTQNDPVDRLHSVLAKKENSGVVFSVLLNGQSIVIK